tara:strand:+ start:303 stop:761 length:459 start_codon:yes stop_codon:yes gene_type:complete
MSNDCATHTHGVTFKTIKNITKNDFIILCKKLENKYSDVRFEPEGITEGGILFKSKDNIGYKTVRFALAQCRLKWPWINDNYLSEWTGSNDVLFKKNEKWPTILKSYYGAPPFTIEELKILVECFNEVGIVKVGRYPSKKSLLYDNLLNDLI